MSELKELQGIKRVLSGMREVELPLSNVKEQLDILRLEIKKLEDYVDVIKVAASNDEDSIYLIQWSDSILSFIYSSSFFIF